MTYQIEISNYTSGRPTATLATFGNIESARQAILDHSNTIDLPEIIYGYNYFALATLDSIESWIIDDTEYNIRLVQ